MKIVKFWSFLLLTFMNFIFLTSLAFYFYLFPFDFHLCPFHFYCLAFYFHLFPFYFHLFPFDFHCLAFYFHFVSFFIGIMSGYTQDFSFCWYCFLFIVLFLFSILEMLSSDSFDRVLILFERKLFSVRFSQNTFAFGSLCESFLSKGSFSYLLWWILVKMVGNELSIDHSTNIIVFDRTILSGNRKFEIWLLTLH